MAFMVPAWFVLLLFRATASAFGRTCAVEAVDAVCEHTAMSLLQYEHRLRRHRDGQAVSLAQVRAGEDGFNRASIGAVYFPEGDNMTGWDAISAAAYAKEMDSNLRKANEERESSVEGETRATRFVRQGSEELGTEGTPGMGIDVLERSGRHVSSPAGGHRTGRDENGVGSHAKQLDAHVKEKKVAINEEEEEKDEQEDEEAGDEASEATDFVRHALDKVFADSTTRNAPKMSGRTDLMAEVDSPAAVGGSDMSGRPAGNAAVGSAAAIGESMPPTVEAVQKIPLGAQSIARDSFVPPFEAQSETVNLTQALGVDNGATGSDAEQVASSGASPMASVRSAPAFDDQVVAMSSMATAKEVPWPPGCENGNCTNLAEQKKRRTLTDLSVKIPAIAFLLVCLLSYLVMICCFCKAR